MATFMGQPMSGRYSKEVDDLKAWFAERLPDLGPFTMSKAGYGAGADALPEAQQLLTQAAFQEWLNDRKYELSYSQTCQAFFAAANDLELLTVV